ncbi:hypothetical protein HKCCE3408_07370 [Rhodobacterales bacterium HKCCE3408]|nr:hypothetical protein [Rhodobacterales bacterium HKCCE3408]
MTDVVIGRINPNPARRIAATGVSALLGVLLIYSVATFPPPSLAGIVFLLAIGLGSLWLSTVIWRATGRALELTREQLRETDGRQLCRVEEITKIERGFFAFKPASGFALILSEPKPRVWAPGLWWRSGRRVMVGGATGGAEARAVAELIEVMLKERKGR